MKANFQDEEDRLELALKASNEGVWDWNILTGEIVYSNRVLGFLGYGQVGAPNIFADLDQHVHPDHLAEFQRKMDRILMRNGRLLAVEPRFKTRGGNWKWFRVRAIPVRGEAGEVVRLVGTMIDISKRKNAEAALAEEQERLQVLLENIPVNVYFKDKESRFVRANRATAIRMGAQTVEEIIGKSDKDFFGKEHADVSRADELEMMSSGEGFRDKLEHEVWSDAEDTWGLVTKYPWRGADGEVKGTFGITNDVTELIKAQEQTRAVAEQLAAMNQDIEDERHLLRLVIDNIPMYVYFKDLSSDFVLVNRHMVDLFGVESPQDVVGKHDRNFYGERHGIVAGADESAIMESGEPIVGRLEKIDWDSGRVTWSLTSKFPWYDQAGNIAGTFGVSGDVTELVETRNAFAEITDVLGRKNQAIEEELKLAREVQQAAIPESLPTFRGNGKIVDFYHIYEPASDLAGDFFEVIPLGNDRAGFLVCDVMGHGVRAALIVSMLRGLIEKVSDVGDEPGQFLKGLNDGLSHLLDRTSLTMFATAVYGVVDLPKSELRLSLAGHPPPLIKQNGKVQKLEFSAQQKGPALGLMEGCEYGEQTIPLKDVEGLLCFTDGILEAENEEGDQFGSEGVAEILSKEGNLRKGMHQALRDGRAFSVEGRFDDDVCLLGLEILPE